MKVISEKTVDLSGGKAFLKMCFYIGSVRAALQPQINLAYADTAVCQIYALVFET